MATDDQRDGNARWLAELALQVRADALRLVGSNDAAAQEELAALAGVLARFSKATAQAAAAARQMALPLFVGRDSTERASR